MHNAESRQQYWQGIETAWDMIVVGGGITGAGIFREAARWGLRVLLVEQSDFGSGTSSRSSKLVHGGLRYLATGQWHVTWESVRERQRLLREAPGLVEPLGFVTPIYAGEFPGPKVMRTALGFYDAMAGHARSANISTADIVAQVPFINQQGLVGGVYYEDAQTDDCRLVWRVLQEAMDDNPDAIALNYMQATRPEKKPGRVSGLWLKDVETGEEKLAEATVVINAAGVWADQLAEDQLDKPRIRPLRGSHLVFPFWRLPLAQAATIFHPQDRRAMFALPWEGVTLFGTTDLDHEQNLNTTPRITADETAYLMRAIQQLFPRLNLQAEDVISTYAGVRPVVDRGEKDPSSESREHEIWDDQGMLTVTGGKLTTFRRIALEALDKIKHRLPALSRIDPKLPVLRPVAVGVTKGVAEPLGKRLRGRVGVHAEAMIADAGPEALQTVGNSPYLWAELRRAAKAEAVVHLDDLLLRRTRIGLVLPNGGKAYFAGVKAICEQELGWDEARWQHEVTAYEQCWVAYHSPQAAGSL